MFETCVNKLTQNPESAHKAKPLLAYMHKREADYGDLGRVVELERRMAELYPEDPKLAQFSKRFSNEKFDPIAARIIISPAAQLRPKAVMQSIEKPTSMQNSPRPLLRHPNSPRNQLLHTTTTNSPKRPFPVEDLEDLNPPRKIQRGDQRDFQRGESPLKGAAGRRLDQQRRMQGGQGPVQSSAPPAPLPTMVTFLLGQIPPAEQYNGNRLNPSALVRLIQDTDMNVNATTNSNAWDGPRGGKNSRQANAHHARQAGQSHVRQISADYSQNQFQGRNSPGLSGRPASPYSGDRGRLAPASGTYRQSSLRPESRDSYEPPQPLAPQVAYRQDTQPSQYGGPVPAQYDSANIGIPAWQLQQQQPPPAGYGAPPPQQPYAPAAYQQPPPQQGPYNGSYRY